MKILLVVYDNDSYIRYFPLGIAYIAGALREAGHQVEIYSQDIHHYADSHLTTYLNNNQFDVIGLGVIGGYYQYRKLIAISKAINESTNRPFYVLGGHGPAPAPKYFLGKTGADVIVIGEGEETIVELLAAVHNNADLATVKGIAFRQGEDVIITPRRPLILDVDSIALPAYDLFLMEHYRLERAPHTDKTDFVMTILSGRGCKFSCNFCYRMDKGFRPRSNRAIIEEIKLLKDKYRINYIIFLDELLMSSVERTKSLCNDMIDAKLEIKWWCNGRLNFARPDVLKLMKAAGCVFVNYGIEAMDDEALKNMNKVLTTEQIIKGVEATLAEGVSPGLNIIFGNIGETREILKKDVEFLKKYGDGSQIRTIRPVTPYPGSPLYYYAIEKGLLKDIADFYENKHTNSDLLTVNFTNLTDDEFYEVLREANIELTHDYYDKNKEKATSQINHLYLKRDASFRGFRST